MPEPIVPRLFDPGVAQRVGGALTTGLPGYLCIRTVDVAPARLTCELDVREELLNPFGTLHGGVVSALVDHVLGAVLYPHIEPGRWAATTSFTLNLLGAVRHGRVRAVATIVSQTKRLAVVQVEVTNAERLVALAQGTVSMPDPPTTTAAKEPAP